MSFSTTSQESNIGAVTIICGWVLSGLATIAVSLMIWARRLCLVRLGADDYILITAYIMTIVLVAQTTWAIIDEGQGQHVADVPRTQLALIASSLLAEETLWGIVNTLLRISVLLFTKRLFGVIRHVRYLLNGLIVLSVLYCVVIVLEIFLICRSLAAAWDTDISGECGQEVVSYVVLETFGLFLDLAILIVPMPTIWGLHLSFMVKIRTSCLLSAGAMVIVVTGLRIQALHMVISTDFTYSRGYLGLLSVLGVLLSIITCCVPCLAPIFEQKKVAVWTVTVATQRHRSTVVVLCQIPDKKRDLEASVASKDSGSTSHASSSAVTANATSTNIRDA